MKSISEGLAASGLGRLASSIELAAKESIRLFMAEGPGNETNRFGGMPNLPSGIEWPTNNGQPLGFVAQIDLATLPPMRELCLPRTGALFFFYDGISAGFQPEDRNTFRVLYSSDNPARVSERPFPSELEESLRFQEARLSLGQVELSLPGWEDTLVEQFGLSRKERLAYSDFQEQYCPGVADNVIHRIGGYPDCVQDDPKLEAQLVSHGLYCGDASGYLAGRERGLCSGVSWDLLLQVDSEEETGMLWGDAGRLYFLIHRSDLAKRCFENAWMIFQCA